MVRIMPLSLLDDAGMGGIIELGNFRYLPSRYKGLGRRLLGNAECPENTFLACQRFYEIIADFSTYFFLARNAIWPLHPLQFIHIE